MTVKRWFTRAHGPEHLDRVITGMLAEHALPGGSVAVAKEGRLVFARGYGVSNNSGDAGNVEPGGAAESERIRPDQALPIASISKPITATAVLRLVEDGALALDDLVIDHLGGLWERGAIADDRLTTITIRHLLGHRGGWPGTDVVPAAAIAALGHTGASDPRAVVRFMAQQPLQSPPGTTYTYSNFGYVLLGRVIEHVTGRPYGDAVMQLVLRPVGASGARLSSAPQAIAYDAAAGWELSSIDLVRFAIGLDGRRPPALLRRETLRLVEAPPTALAAPSMRRDWRLWRWPRPYDGLGWGILPGRFWWLGQRPVLWSHLGGLPTGCALLCRGSRGFTVAAVFTALPRGGPGKIMSLVRPLTRAMFAVRAWPAADLFDDYP
jgi:CubicO group peptidase (beta-lactamase class C family)